MTYPQPCPAAVSADWLAAHLADPQVAIADCRFSLADPALGRQQYQAGHIPGAVYFDLNQHLSGPVQVHGGRHPLPEPQVLAATLAAAGITSGGDRPPTWVVAYDDSRFGFAARFWWLLRYLGHDQVSVLDGGFSQWQAHGYPVSPEMPVPQPGAFVPVVRSHWVVDRSVVQARKGSSETVLIDSREGDRYRGEREPIDPVAGHIPGAVNYPWLDVTDALGYLRPLAEQQQRWQAIRQLPPDQREIVVYCGSGVTACVNLLSLAIAEIGPAALYAGSWSDWCAYPEAEVSR